MKRLLYIILLAFLLTACGKAETVKEEKKRKDALEKGKRKGQRSGANGG